MYVDVDDGNFGDVGVVDGFVCVDVGGGLFEDFQGVQVIVVMYCEGEVGGVIVCYVLYDYVDFYIGGIDWFEDFEGYVGGIGYVMDGQFGFVVVEGDVGDDWLFYGFFFIIDSNEGVWIFLEVVQYVQWNVVFVGEFDCLDLQYFGIEVGYFQYFFEGDFVQLMGLWYYVWIGGVDVVDVGVDLVFVGF